MGVLSKMKYSDRKAAVIAKILSENTGKDIKINGWIAYYWTGEKHEQFSLGTLAGMMGIRQALDRHKAAHEIAANLY